MKRFSHVPSMLPILNNSVENFVENMTKPRNSLGDRFKLLSLPKVKPENNRTVGLNRSDSTVAAFASDTPQGLIRQLNTRNKTRQPSEHLCPSDPKQLQGICKIEKSAPPFPVLEKQHPEVVEGGRWFPKECVARHRVAIIIPFRDREDHLRIFLQHMHPILQRQQLDYGIYVVEQAGSGDFNRGMLLNIGFLESMRLYDYQCIIMHDVDLLPENDKNLYECPEQPRHMSVGVDTMRYRLPYIDIFGGVAAMKKKHFIEVNGFSNQFWGWGGEDDDLSNRIRYHGYNVIRHSATTDRYQMMRHKMEVPNPYRCYLVKEGEKRYETDGLRNVKYKVIDLQLKRLYTWIYVSLDRMSEDMPPINMKNLC